jgi:hypothetical protein
MTTPIRRSALKTSIRALICTAAGAAALAASASPALADGFSLKLTQPSPAVVGHPIVIHGEGTMPPGDVQFPYWFSLVAIPPSVTTTCPEDMWEAVQFARGAGGATIVLQQREIPDASGRFSVPVALTPTAAGTLLLCAYTDDGETQTLATASLLFEIRSGSSSQAPSRPVSPPVQVARDIKGCLALLGPRGGRHCIGQAVKRANAGCRRRYHSHRRQARCLHAVRRVARKHS